MTQTSYTTKTSKPQPAKRPPLFSRGALLMGTVLAMIAVYLVYQLATDWPIADLRLAAAVLLTGLLTYSFGQLIRYRFRLSWPGRIAIVLVLLTGLAFAWHLNDTWRETALAEWVNEHGGYASYANGLNADADYTRTADGWYLPGWTIKVLGRSYFDTLDHVHLLGPEFSDDDVARLDAIRHVNRISIKGTSVTAEGLAQIPIIPGVENLEVDWSLISLASVARLRQFEELKHLTIIGKDETTAPVQAPIEQLGELKQIRSLGLSAQTLDANDAAALAALPNLEFLTIWSPLSDEQDNRETPDAAPSAIAETDDLQPFVKLGESLSLKGMRLNVSHMKLAAEDLRALAAIPTMNLLQIDDYSGQAISVTDEELKAIAREFPLVNIQVQVYTAELIEQMKQGGK